MTRRLVLPVLLLLAVSACGDKDTKLKVTGIEPERGDVDGGTYVRIKGNRFIDDGPRNAKVYFGSRQGTVVRFASDSELIVEAPGGSPNEKVDVLIIFDPGGQLKIKDGFTFVEKNDAGPSVQDLDISKPKK
ncbi:MAG: IPT/TIG domain-containing protein [Deltaproteobacteria bacterium]|nr:IPT/TIG domain-containing protein [Deltaproteobacteria bacterium]